MRALLFALSCLALAACLVLMALDSTPTPTVTDPSFDPNNATPYREDP